MKENHIVEKFIEQVEVLAQASIDVMGGVNRTGILLAESPEAMEIAKKANPDMPHRPAMVNVDLRKIPMGKWRQEMNEWVEEVDACLVAILWECTRTVYLKNKHIEKRERLDDEMIAVLYLETATRQQAHTWEIRKMENKLIMGIRKTIDSACMEHGINIGCLRGLFPAGRN